MESKKNCLVPTLIFSRLTIFHLFRLKSSHFNWLSRCFALFSIAGPCTTLNFAANLSTLDDRGERKKILPFFIQTFLIFFLSLVHSNFSLFAFIASDSSAENYCGPQTAMPMTVHRTTTI
jgi:hypothetical protein